MEDKVQISCMHCQQLFTPRIITQRFCSGAHRIIFNNNRANSLRRYTSGFDKAIKSNYRIIKELIQGKEEYEDSLDFFRGRGYNFNVMHGIKIINGERHIATYDYVLIAKPNNRYLIKKYL